MTNTTDGRAPSPPTTPAADEPSMCEIVIAVSNLEDLFNPPTVNPFTDHDLRAMGEPALARAIRSLQVGGLRDQRPVRLRIEILADEVTGTDGQTKVADAVHRYCVAKIADNTEVIHLTRRRARRGLQVAFALVLIFFVLAYVLLTTLLSQAGTVIQGIVVGSLSVFTWVVLWDTLEAWIFNPIPASFENRALSKLQRADVVVDVTAE